MGSATALAGDVKDAQAKVAQLKIEHAEKYTAAEAVHAEFKAKHPDVNVLLADDDLFRPIADAYREADEIKAHIAKINDRLANEIGRDGVEIVGNTLADDRRKGGRRETIGERLIASAQYREVKASGVLETTGRFNLSGVEVASRDEVRRFLAAASSGVGLIGNDQQLGNPIPIPRRTPRLLDFITVASTDSNTVEYSKQSTRTNNAANVAVGTASAQSEYAWSKETATVRRIAHHVIVPKSQLADEARIATELDSELEQGVMHRTEAQVLAGGGTGQDFAGIVGTAGISTVDGTGLTIPDAIHNGITAVRIALEGDITAIGIHPTDMESFALAKDENGQYLSGRGPQDPTAPTIWGYPAIVSTLFTQGTAVAADWTRAFLWVRSGIALSSGYIDDQLIEDMITMLAEYRAAFAVRQPKGFCTVTDLGAV